MTYTNSEVNFNKNYKNIIAYSKENTNMYKIDEKKDKGEPEENNLIFNTPIMSLSEVLPADNIIKDSLMYKLPWFVNDPHVSDEAMKQGVEYTKQVDKDVLQKCVNINYFCLLLGAVEASNIIDSDICDEYIRMLNKLNNLSEANIAEITMKLIETVDEVVPSNCHFSDNVEYFKDKDIGLYSNNQFFNILYSDKNDLSEQKEKLDSILDADKEDILKQLKCRTKDKNPEFYKKAEKIMNDPIQSEQLMLLDNLSADSIVDAFQGLSKIDAQVKSNPEKYVNGTSTEKADETLEKLQTDIMIAYSFTDFETMNLLLDKRFDDFSKEINKLVLMPERDKKDISTVINHGKRINKKGMPDKLTGAQKLDTIKLINTAYSIENKTGEEFDLNKYKIQIKGDDFIFDIDGLRNDVLHRILGVYGFSKEEIKKLNPNDLNWDLNYISLLAKTPECDEGELEDLVREASKGNFDEYIKDSSNEYGKANKLTEYVFKACELDFDAWENGIEPKQAEVAGEKYNIKLWNRCPQESIFDGSYTNCCTALDAVNGGSMASYLMNKSINVAEMRDKNGNVKAMSRFFVGMVNNKPSIIIDNLEVNNGLIKKIKKSKKEQKALSSAMYGYIKEMAKAVGGEDMPVYASDSYLKLDPDIMKQYKKAKIKIDFLGGLSREDLYINTYGDYINPDDMRGISKTLYVIKK